MNFHTGKLKNLRNFQNFTPWAARCHSDKFWRENSIFKRSKQTAEKGKKAADKYKQTIDSVKNSS